MLSRVELMNAAIDLSDTFSLFQIKCVKLINMLHLIK